MSTKCDKKYLSKTKQEIQQQANKVSDMLIGSTLCYEGCQGLMGKLDDSVNSANGAHGHSCRINIINAYMSF